MKSGAESKSVQQGVVDGAISKILGSWSPVGSPITWFDKYLICLMVPMFSPGCVFFLMLMK